MAVNNDPLLLILDGNNLLIRAFFAHRWKTEDGYEYLKNADGELTGGVYGALSSLFKYYRTFQPTHILWTFDWGKSEYRSSLDQDYKGNRIHSEKDGVLTQFGPLEKALSLLGVRHYREKNVEADDIMAAAALNAEALGVPSVIISTDHDLRQLISDKITVVKPSMGRAPETIFNKKKSDAFPLTPRRMPEIWALTGDSSDNIAGIKGVGPAKARKLIEEYGNLNTLLEEYDKFSEEEVERVRTNYRLIKLDGELATYSNFPFSSCEFLPGEIDTKSLNDFFDKYGFKKFKTQLQKGELL